MPTQKDLKRIVRTRMQKTGESYTTARLYVVKKTETPKPDYEVLAGMSNAALKKQTGREWAEWVETLDAIEASKMPHREIADYVYSLGVSGWWSQSVTVGYERIRGLRDLGQRRGGLYEANKSKTFSVPVKKLFEACANARKRAKWLPVKVVVRTKVENKSIRLNWDDGTRVQLYFTAKGNGTCAIAVQHERIADKASAERLKTWWGERLNALAASLR